MRSKVFIPAILWLITSTILLTLPGNDLPHIPFLNFPYSDKFIHVGMFMLLSGFFGYPLGLGHRNISPLKWRFFMVALYVLAYGILMEFVQKYFVAGRSFDLSDILADGIGSFAGMLIVLKIYLKKIGPDGNRGRNQN